ncbi:MAG: hypothetical protein CVV02_05780 [Firmicutes bacterium HGW-Firmicutes-7]|nr:MAG: hypothetical protein CVV02_05780 [Firmicutes bacterium HGW-Firmicutes-7]
MVKIFLSQSSKDIDIINSIINNLKSLSDYYKLLYFLRPYKSDMERVMKNLSISDLFIVFITNNSLDSKFVNEELEKAFELVMTGQIKEICPILLDNNIDVNLDSRIPWFIKNNKIYHTKSPVKAAQIAKNFICKY